MSQNLSATTPAAPGGNVNVTWQADKNGNISGYVPSSSSSSETVNAQTGTSYLVVDGDKGKLVTLTNASPVAVSLPTPGVTFVNGWYADFVNEGAGLVTITPVAATIDGAASLQLSNLQGVRVVSDGVNYFTVRGKSTAGTVTSVAMTGDGVLQEAVVSGSPITGSGTLAPTPKSTNPNLFIAGPTSGPAAALAARAIAAADFNGGTGASSTTFLKGDLTWGTPGAGTGLANRSTVTSTYTSLAAGATDSSQAPTMFKSFELLGISITSNKKCRIRLYSTAAARTADLNRSYSTPLALGTQHGCIADFYFDQVYATTPWICSPNVFGSNQDGSVSAAIYASVTNIDTSTQTIVVIYTIVQLEN